MFPSTSGPRTGFSLPCSCRLPNLKQQWGDSCLTVGQVWPPPSCLFQLGKTARVGRLKPLLPQCCLYKLDPSALGNISSPTTCLSLTRNTAGAGRTPTRLVSEVTYSLAPSGEDWRVPASASKDLAVPGRLNFFFLFKAVAWIKWRKAETWSLSSLKEKCDRNVMHRLLN